jgi:hypothetical protein
LTATLKPLHSTIPGATPGFFRGLIDADISYGGQNIHQSLSNGTDITKNNVSNKSQTAEPILRGPCLTDEHVCNRKVVAPAGSTGRKFRERQPAKSCVEYHPYLL